MTTHYDTDVGDKDPLYNVDEAVNECSHFWNQFVSFTKESIL